jgi:hypothetical protein
MSGFLLIFLFFFFPFFFFVVLAVFAGVAFGAGYAVVGVADVRSGA